MGCHFLFQGSSGPKDRSHSSRIGRQILCHWATRGARYVSNGTSEYSVSSSCSALTSLLWHTHTHTHLHMHAHTFTHLYPPLLPLHVPFRSLYLELSLPTNFTFISDLHLLCPQREFINCFFYILIKFSVRHFNILAGPSIPFCFPGDSLLEPWALLTHPGLAGLDTSHTAGIPSLEFHFPQSCWIPIFSDLYVFHYLDNFPYFYGQYPAALSFFLATLCSTQDLSSLTGDWTHIPCSGSLES